MLHALLTLAAAEEHTSKTAFYLLGGALTAYAVALSALGLSKAEFPTGSGAAKGVMALSTLLVLGVVAATLATA